MSIFVKSSSGVNTIAKRPKVWCALSLALAIIPDEDCDVIVTHELDGWGYDGNKWERIITCSVSGPVKAIERTLICQGHNTLQSYAKGIAVFTGLKAGTTYEFISKDKTGRTGGFANGFMSIIPVQLV